MSSVRSLRRGSIARQWRVWGDNAGLLLESTAPMRGLPTEWTNQYVNRGYDSYASGANSLRVD